MSERPILMSAPMVRAILAGTKTQTRRAIKPQPEHPQFGKRKMLALDDEGVDLYLHAGPLLARAIRCPYGAPSDKLWVRESGWERPPHHKDRGHPYAYDADAPFGVDPANEAYRDEGWKRRPSIHMPRRASRITLEVTGVRVERLQDISEADAIAEGVHPDQGGRQDDDAAAFHRIGAVRGDSFPIARYAALWESINGAGSWAANPWVWCVEFRRTDR